MENPKSRRTNNRASRIRLNARPSLHVSLWHNRCGLVDALSFIFPLVPESVFFHYLLGEESHNADLHQSEGRYLVNRFFVFIDGFWCGLDDGFFPWDYYPYYTYDYYPYDYYPGYYADVEPYYYNENVYSSAPMVDPTVTAVQKQLAQLGYYSGPIDGIYGPLVRDAVAKYQIAMHQDVSGSLSPETLQSFGLTRPVAS